MKAYFATLARYNLWATRTLYEHVDALPEAEYRRDCGLFFRSVHGTLNHLLVGEHRLWFVRFAQGVSPKLRLDEEVETDRARLRQALLDGAQRWGPWIESLDAAQLEGVLHYSSMNGTAQVLPFAATLGHVFNHGTHHRGQITAALMGHAGPVLDLVTMLQAESRA